MLEKVLGRFIKNSSESIVNPIRFSLFYLVYIIACEVITNNFSIDGLAYFFLILIGLSIYGYLIRFVFIMISHAGSGQKTTGEAVYNIILSVISGIIFFAINYFYLSVNDPNAFVGHLGNAPLSRLIGCLYYSVITFSTIGYGDIVPYTNMARIVVIGEVLYSVFILVLVISSFSSLKDAMGKNDIGLDQDHIRSRFSKQKFNSKNQSNTDK